MPRMTAFLANLGLLLALTTNAYAEGSGIYVGGIVGASLRPDTTLSSPGLPSQELNYDTGYTFGGFLGYDFANNFRVEWEISYRENQIRNGGGEDPQIGTSSIMLNGFYDGIPLLKSFDLYLGGGLGVATAQLEMVSFGQAFDVHENVFAYQLETGIDWNYNPKATFSLGYRFFNANDPEFLLPLGQRAQMDMETHEFLLKMRYLFNL